MMVTDYFNAALAMIVYYFYVYILFSFKGMQILYLRIRCWLNMLILSNQSGVGRFVDFVLYFCILFFNIQIRISLF